MSLYEYGRLGLLPFVMLSSMRMVCVCECVCLWLPSFASSDCQPVVLQDKKDKLRSHLRQLLSLEPSQVVLSSVESILNPRVKLGTLQ